MSKCCTLFLAAALLSACATVSQPSSALEPQPGDFPISNFAFENRSSLPALTLHYSTFGTPQFDSTGRCTNAVLLLHDTVGEAASQAGQFFTASAMRQALFGPGQPLDASKYYLIIPDALGHGLSTKPSNGLRRRFPHYSDSDIVEAQYRLVTEGLSINHLKLVLGVADGGLQTWLWGERYPNMVDALMPIASAPTTQGGRAGLWQRMAIQSIYTDPDWQEGDYVNPPKKWLDTVALSSLLERNTSQLQQAAGTPANVEKIATDKIKSAYKIRDANDALYAFEAAKQGPNPNLSKIKAQVLALYFQDDAFYADSAQQIEALIKQMPRAKMVEINRSAQTDGRATIGRPEVWKGYITQLLTQPEQPIATPSREKKLGSHIRRLSAAKNNTIPAEKTATMLPTEAVPTESQEILTSRANTPSAVDSTPSSTPAVALSTASSQTMPRVAHKDNQAPIPVPVSAKLGQNQPMQDESATAIDNSNASVTSLSEKPAVVSGSTTIWSSSDQPTAQTIISSPENDNSVAASPIVTSESSSRKVERAADTSNISDVANESMTQQASDAPASTPAVETSDATVSAASTGVSDKQPVSPTPSEDTATTSIREADITSITPVSTPIKADSLPKETTVTDTPSVTIPNTGSSKGMSFLPSPVPRPIS